MDRFKKAKLGFYNDCEKYSNPEEFNALVSDAYSKDWVVYVKEPFNNNKAVLNYIGRYSHRVAISNSRITDYDEVNHTVSFRYKDYKDQSKVKVMTLSAYEFLRRYSMHILPSKFMKIRHYGFMSNTVRSKLIPVCKKLLKVSASIVVAMSKENEKPSKECRCPKCGGKLILFDFAFASPLNIERNTS